MKKRGRRILSFILTAVMVFALLPVFSKPMMVKAENPQGHVHEDKDTDGSNHSNWKKISSWDDLKSLGKDGGSGYLVDNIKISRTLTIYSDITVNLCLNGYSITQTEDYIDTITVYGTLNLYDKKDNSGIITHANKKRGSGVSIVHDGTFIMNGGTISGNNATWGGGVYIYKDGTFTMTGGTISGNNADYGGGVRNIGTFTMTGGTISGNKATYYGGGVCNDGTFTMNGGTIKDNTASKKGSGVYSSNPFVKEGGEIDGSIEDFAGALCTVTFNANDGSDKTIIQYVIPDMETNLASNKFSYGDYKFDCWNTKDDGTGDPYQDEAELKIINSNLVLYARWIEKSYDVTFKVNNGSWFDKTNDDIVVTILRYVGENKELKLNASSIPSINPITGYKGSWDTEPDTENALTENKTYTYTFAPIEYTVEYDSNGGVGTMDDQSRTYDDKEPLTANAFKLAGYTFTGWNTAADGSGVSYADENVSNLSSTDGDTVKLFAQWQANNYTVKFDANGGEGTMDDQSRTYDDKAPLTANVFTFEGKTFNGWNTAADGSGTPYADEEVNNLSSTDGDAVTLYAQWTVDTFTITWKDYNGTVLEADTDVAYGTTPTFDGEPPKRDNSGNIKYTFAGWTPEIDTVKGAATYTATYSEEEIVEPTEPTTPEEPTNPTTPEEPTEPEVPEITEPEPEPEIPEKDWLDDLRLKLQIANELGGPQTVTYSGDFALSYDIMLYLVEHPDITLIYTVTYEGVDYTITIPGGKAIADPNIPWCGPLWLLANYGGENVPDIIAGSGRYTVVEGDTLSGIAEKFNTTVEELAKKNGIKNPDYIIVGQVIVY